MDEMQEYIYLLRVLREAEDKLLNAGEDFPEGLDPLTVQPTDEHVERATKLLQRVVSGDCDGIAEERLLECQEASFFRMKPGTEADEILEAARQRAREKRANERAGKEDRDEDGTKGSNS